MPLPSKSDRRVQFDVLPERLAELDYMMEVSDIRTRKELFDQAFTLFDWALETVMKGERVASYNKENDHVEIVRMPALEAAARRAKATNAEKVSPVKEVDTKENRPKKSHLSVAS